MSAAALEIAGHFDVSRESFERLQAYCELLARWNRRINLMGPAEIGNIWSRHIADGLQLLRFLQPSDQVLADLGSGAGIPGLVVAIGAEGRQPLETHLVERNGKKAAFLQECVRVTGAKCRVHQGRIEAVTPSLGRVDVVTARALAPLPKLIALALPLLQGGARGLFHKGRGIEGELTGAEKSWRLSVTRHPSLVEEGGCILEVQENSHA